MSEEPGSSSWFDNKSKEDIIKEISELRKNIKKKHRALKRDIAEGEEILEKTFKPIADPLKKLVDETSIANEEFIENIDNKRKRKLADSLVKDEESEVLPTKRQVLNPPQGVKRKRKVNLPQKITYHSDSDTDDGQNVDYQPNKRLSTPLPIENVEMDEPSVSNIQEMRTPSPTVEVYETAAGPATGEEFIRTPEGRDLSRQYINRHFTGNLAKEYFSKLISGNKTIDHNYGVTVQGNDWKIGNKQLEIDHNDLIIGGKRYNGTRGLYELIFMNFPDEYVYSEEDLNNYARIIFDTNLHRVNFLPTGKIRSNRGKKYKNIISQILVQAQTDESMDTYADQVLQGNPSGKGILLTEQKPNIVYYDDPNEIVERLRILLASEAAGHSGHMNEINAIIEELKELEPELSNQLLKQ